MILAPEELRRLVELKHPSPHAVLGMHPLADGSGVVVRAFLPQAGKVEVHPLGEKGPPPFELQRIHQKHGVFEGVTQAAKQVYPYELVVTDGSGAVQHQRDPYSFLPTLSEEELYLLGKGDERRLYEKLGAQLRTLEGMAGTSFSVWAPNARRISVVGDFNAWDGRVHQMRRLGSSGIGEIFLPGVGEGAHYKFELRDHNHRIRLKTDPCGMFFEVAPKNAAIVWNNRKFT